ncbi:MAG: efflux RND transporter periplasmic adaptor subunit [Acidobacteria bacterium]|nr:efflux RND transporter periplasmic adaptor subunit [Acidobacteriota bacterium]
MKELKVDIGDYVKSGDVLAVIDVPELRKRRNVIEARLLRFNAQERLAEAGVLMAEANITSVKAKVDEAKSQLLRAEASLAASEAEFRRVGDLVEGRALESRLLDEALNRRDADKAQAQSAQASISSTEADVLVARAKHASAQANLAAAVAESAIAQRQLEELDVTLEYAELKAPFCGVVTARSVDPGDLVREESEVGKAGGRPLFVVSQIDRVRIQMPVPEADAALVNKGDSITMTFPSFPGEKLTTFVSRLSHSLDPSTRTMLVEAEVENPDGKLLPGMFGQASISLSTKTAANMLPARAIRYDESGQAFVYVVGADDKVSIVNVQTGLDDGQSIEILAGVEPDRWIGHRATLEIERHVPRHEPDLPDRRAGADGQR